MILPLIKWFAGFLGDEALKALYSWISQEINSRNLLNHGAAQQAAKEDVATVQALQSEAQAVQDAPHSRLEVLDALDKGGF